MSSEFIARPPLFLGQGSQKGLARHLSRILRGFGRILFQTFVPFNPRPEEPADLSELAGEFDDDQLKQCEKIFDQVEGTRVQLEQKARSTFAVTSFLAPLLAAILLFLLAQTTPQTTSRTFAIVFAASSFIFLLLGFVTIMRAVSVQERQTLLHSAVIDFEDTSTGWGKRDCVVTQIHLALQCTCEFIEAVIDRAGIAGRCGLDRALDDGLGDVVVDDGCRRTFGRSGRCSRRSRYGAG
jgi:hypothetical protein